MTCSPPNGTMNILSEKILKRPNMDECEVITSIYFLELDFEAFVKHLGTRSAAGAAAEHGSRVPRLVPSRVPRPAQT